MWLVWAVVALLGWGIWGVAASESSHSVSPLAAATIAAGIEFVVITIAFVLAPSSKIPGDSQLSWWVVAAGGASAVAYIGFFKAFGSGNQHATVVTALTSLYPIVTAVLAVLFLGETLRWYQTVGVGMAVVAAVLIAL